MFETSKVSRTRLGQYPKSMTALGRRRFGAATVEIALVAPVIFLLVFGSIEFARMMMVRQAFTNAAREGCRTACLATTQSDDSPKTVIREMLKGVVVEATTTEDLRISIEPNFKTIPDTGTSITTIIEIDCEDVSWLPPFLTRGVKIRCRSKMNRE